MYKANVQVETTINVPREEVFNFLVNPHQIPLVLNGLIENTNVPELPLKVGDSFRYKYQTAGVVLEGDWVVTELEAPTRYVARTTGGGDSEWSYDISEHNGSTHVALSVSYDPPQSILERVQQSILERIVQKDGEAYMFNLKTLLEMRGA